MQCRLSRHAKRRIKLYAIPERMIIDIVGAMVLSPGIHEIVERIPGIVYPVKIIVSVEGETATIVTSYPLKRGRIR